ncbi:hypothetical protein [Streptomyces sp. YGL11-2]|uniref:hypothetical protein n=1 Tax=Streptomyces sp. YGL11-2 TaxID=3414028 RepID=UPI003CEB7294
MTATLTDRYVAATVRRVPDRQRREIERELRAVIADDIDARVEHGEGPGGAERAALTALGDPRLLAGRYAHHGVGLIGPDTYPGYRHALRSVAWSVLPTVYVVLALVHRAHGENAWAALLRPLGGTVNAAMYLAVCVTIPFVIADRVRRARPEADRSAGPWTPDQLPTADEPRPATTRDLVGTIVKGAALMAALFAQRVVSPVTTAGGAHVPIVNPALWHFWIPYFLTVLALTVAIDAVALRLRTGHPFTAVAHAVLTVAGTLPLGWLFWQAQVLNPALAGSAGAPTPLAAPGSWIAWLAALVLALATAGTLAQTLRAVRRGRAVTA